MQSQIQSELSRLPLPDFVLPEGRYTCRHQLTYKIAAISASLGVTSLAIVAVHYRFAWHMRNGGDVPWAEAALTILLTFGGVVSASFDAYC